MKKGEKKDLSFDCSKLVSSESLVFLLILFSSSFISVFYLNGEIHLSLYAFFLFDKSDRCIQNSKLLQYFLITEKLMKKKRSHSIHSMAGESNKKYTINIEEVNVCCVCVWLQLHQRFFSPFGSRSGFQGKNSNDIPLQTEIAKCFVRFLLLLFAIYCLQLKRKSKKATSRKKRNPYRSLHSLPAPGNLFSAGKFWRLRIV